VVGVVLAGAAASGLKPVIARTYDGAVTFPSGHTAGITAVALVTALLLVSAANSRRWAAGLAAFGVLAVAALMGVSLVAVGAHFPSDILGGFLVALTAVSATAAALAPPAPSVTR
jgi:undecaprenyl-diphosphatase